MEAKEIYESKINEVNNLQLYSHEEKEEGIVNAYIFIRELKSKIQSLKQQQ